MPVTVTHAKSNIIADWTGTVTVGNSSGGTSTMQATDLVRPQDWNSAHAITFQVTGSEVASLFNFGTGLTSTTNAAGVTVGMNPATWFEPDFLLNTNSTMIAYPAGTWYVEPLNVLDGLARGRFAFPMTYNSSIFLQGVVGSAASTGQATKTATFYNRFAIYSQGTGANSTRIESYWTGDHNWSATQSITYSSTATNDVRVTNALTIGYIGSIDSLGGTTSATQTASGTLVVAASTMASTAPNSLITAAQNWITGSDLVYVPFNTTLAPGNYWLAHMHTISSGGGTTGGGNYLAGTMFNSAPGRMGILDPVLTAFRQVGYSVTTANSTTLGIPFKGHLATTTSAATSNMATGDMRATTGRLYFNFAQRTTPQ